MTIVLTPEHQRMIERAVHSGAYHDASDVISAALEAFKDTATSSANATERQRREAAIERLKTFGEKHKLSLGGITLEQLRREAP